jgi:hypothetical protein
MECRVYKIIPVGEIGDHMIIGEVLRFHIRDDLYLERGRIDTAAIHSVGRLAAEYTLVENVFVTPLATKRYCEAGQTSECIGWTPTQTAGLR